MRKCIFTLFTALFFSSCSFADDGRDTIGHIVDRYVANRWFNGAILVAHGNHIIYEGYHGCANLENHDTITPVTLFPIASLTKQFTAVAILILQHDGKLSVDDRISNYVAVPECMQNIAIRNLLNHSSGIPDYLRNNVAKKRESVLAYIASIDSLNFPPGSRYSYSNTGYFLLGEIIERVSGNSYGKFLRDRIFIPTGMRHTLLNDGKRHTRAYGYDTSWVRNDFLMSTADGGILSTIRDIYLWDKALFENRIIPQELKLLMFQPYVLDNGTIVFYGFGWDIDAINRTIASHTGWLASFGAYNQIDNRKGYFLILLSNQIRPQLLNLINEINSELYGRNSP